MMFCNIQQKRNLITGTLNNVFSASGERHSIVSTSQTDFSFICLISIKTVTNSDISSEILVQIVFKTMKIISNHGNNSFDVE